LAKSLSWTLLLVLMFVVPVPELSAQQDPWTISFEVESGVYAPTRSFGKNSRGTDDPSLVALQPSAKANPVAIFGGGLRIQLPNPMMSLRLSGYRTAVGTVESRTPACDVLSVLDPEALPVRARLQCDSPFTEKFTISEVVARVQFKRLSDEGQRLRPTIDLGIGLRQYNFGGPDCLNDATLLQEARFICDNAEKLTANQTTPLILFGIGLEYTLDRFAIFARLHDQLSPYTVASITGEESQNDLMASVGFSVNVR
jgi:hypothetical protein